MGILGMSARKKHAIAKIFSAGKKVSHTVVANTQIKVSTMTDIFGGPGTLAGNKSSQNPDISKS
ncbi:MAG: hypothetical protein RLP14_08120 [Owenweeksia sp.]